MKFHNARLDRYKDNAKFLSTACNQYYMKKHEIGAVTSISTVYDRRRTLLLDR